MDRIRLPLSAHLVSPVSKFRKYVITRLIEISKCPRPDPRRNGALGPSLRRRSGFDTTPTDPVSPADPRLAGFRTARRRGDLHSEHVVRPSRADLSGSAGLTMWLLAATI